MVLENVGIDQSVTRMVMSWPPRVKGYTYIFNISSRNRADPLMILYIDQALHTYTTVTTMDGGKGLQGE